ncbi:glycoside hydrolase family 31 protein [Zymoseptoria brevis]|uniref:Glycoside hydrolase family 31 protein n=1 Tax=Zymoseptoria brevis TaxID=1047168 RepID=A0A0F4GHN0_9PEZI|nr:glycoside hydrolase family 31 protein [Zymoseptoria brevis]
MMYQEDNRLVFRFDDHILWIDPWGPNALRVRATKLAKMPVGEGALLGQPDANAKIQINDDGSGEIVNGSIRATISRRGKIVMYNGNGEKVLEEYARNRQDLLDPKCSALEVEARELRPILGGDFQATLRLESLSPKEKLYGMGQYQQPYLNLKGSDIELAHRNSQASVPFVLSSLGYGFLWNNPAIGRAVLGTNVMTFEAYSTRSLDYWIVAGGTPAAIEETYAQVTGYVPMMPEYGLGFWQCKLRYASQEELLQVAREHKRRGLPMDVIVCDFFHWIYQGDWSFDPKYWPDPAAMVKELRDLGIELMVSIWPTVAPESVNYPEMREKGLLIRVDRGVRVAMQCGGDSVHIDTTNPEARKFLWSKVKQNYYDYGIKIFWADEAEPEYSIYDFDLYRYHAGPNMQIGNTYPVCYAQALYEGMESAGQKNIVNLLRCAWAGSQRYGALVWSGDIASSWESFRNQLSAGLSMGIAGIPWWTTDIGGFHGGNPDDPAFRELLIRWFQWGAFCPVMRLHGDREPKSEGDPTAPGAANEVWSYGEEAYPILVDYLHIREEMREYTRGLMRQAHEKGSPVMRTCFYEFPADPKCWEVEEQYMYGDKYLVIPVLQPGVSEIEVYLPRGAKWKRWGSDVVREGGVTLQESCPIDSMPVFIRQEE